MRCTFPFQWKYRIQAHHKAAAVGGAHGQAVAVDTEFNGIINDKGCSNTNKAGDLKVEYGIHRLFSRLTC